MSGDFVSVPMRKKMNGHNIMSRIDKLERLTGPHASTYRRAATLGEVANTIDDIQGLVPAQGVLTRSSLGALEWQGSSFVPLTTPLGPPAAFDAGDAFSTTAKTLIDLSAVFGVPAGVRAVLMVASIRDSASATTSACWLCLSPNNTDSEGVFIDCQGLTNNYNERNTLIVPCDTNGDIYYQCVASGAGTMRIYLQIWGYWI